MNTAELKKLAEAATPGPWKWDGDPSAYDQENESPWLVDAKDSYPPVIGGTVKCKMAADAAYIAAANPAAILELLEINAELVEALRELHSRLSKAMELNVSAHDAYDSFYQEIVIAALAKAEGGEL